MFQNEAMQTPPVVSVEVGVLGREDSRVELVGE